MAPAATAPTEPFRAGWRPPAAVAERESRSATRWVAEVRRLKSVTAPRSRQTHLVSLHGGSLGSSRWGVRKQNTSQPRRCAELCSRLGLAPCAAARGVNSWGPAGGLRFRQLGGAGLGSRVATAPALVGASNSRQAASAVVASQQSRFFPKAAGHLNAAATQLKPSGQLLHNQRCAIRGSCEFE